MCMMPADDWCLQTKALPRGFGCHLVPADKSAHLRFWLSVDACKQKRSPKVLVVTWCQCTKAPARGVYTPKKRSTPWNKFRTPAAMGHEMMPLPLPCPPLVPAWGLCSPFEARAPSTMLLPCPLLVPAWGLWRFVRCSRLSL